MNSASDSRILPHKLEDYAKKLNAEKVKELVESEDESNRVTLSHSELGGSSSTISSRDNKSLVTSEFFFLSGY